MTEQELDHYAKQQIRTIKDRLFHEETGAINDAENFSTAEALDQLEQTVNNDFQALIDRVMELEGDLDEMIDMQIAMSRAALLEEIDELRAERIK
jgi:hypothetical protein